MQVGKMLYDAERDLLAIAKFLVYLCDLQKAITVGL